MIVRNHTILVLVESPIVVFIYPVDYYQLKSIIQCKRCF